MNFFNYSLILFETYVLVNNVVVILICWLLISAAPKKGRGKKDVESDAGASDADNKSDTKEEADAEEESTKENGVESETLAENGKEATPEESAETKPAAKKGKGKAPAKKGKAGAKSKAAEATNGDKEETNEPEAVTAQSD